MIPVLTLSYEIDQRLNKLSTFNHQEIPLEDKVIAINNAVITLIKTKVDGNNVHKLGLDAFRKRYQDLQFLIENTEDHEFKLEESDKNLNRFIFKLTDIKPKFMFYIQSYLLADKGECKNRIIYADTELVKHADLIFLLKNSNYKPSFEYQDTICDISSDELHYYTDGTFQFSKGYLSYMRYPKEVDLKGYVKFDGSDSSNVDCELEFYLKDEILDIAIENLAMYIENDNAAKYAEQRKNENE